MQFIKRKFPWFFKKEEPKEEVEEPLKVERVYRDLLRENLNTIAVDVFYLDDPIVGLSPAQRREYLMHFNRMVRNGFLIKRFQYFINKQAQMILTNSLNKESDLVGAMKLDGFGTFKDDVERLSNMFIKEEAEHNKQEIDPKDIMRL